MRAKQIGLQVRTVLSLEGLRFRPATDLRYAVEEDSPGSIDRRVQRRRYEATTGHYLSSSTTSWIVTFATTPTGISLFHIPRLRDDQVHDTEVDLTTGIEIIPSTKVSQLELSCTQRGVSKGYALLTLSLLENDSVPVLPMWI